jgi:anti-sigma factor RsiW
MNCKQARDLFSARIDGELSALEERELRDHLTECDSGCPERWVSFETTVRLVHALPAVEPDPSFVGQVLDRVRGYEAGQIRPRMSVRRSWPSRLRELVGELPAFFPAPARLATVGVFGLVLGFVLASSVDWRGSAGPSSTIASAGRGPANASEHARSEVASSRSLDPDRPFADLAGDLSLGEYARTQDDSVAQDPYPASAPSGVDAPLRIVKSDARPQITF